MRKAGEPCILEDRICTECGECDRCELHPEKICDNCCQCIDNEADFLEVRIDDILLNEEDRDTREAATARIFRLKSRKQS